jgi:hypothetical protein
MENLIFISRITEEAGVATALRELIRDNFPEPLNIFVSSDGESIKMGRDWPKIVLTKSTECTAQIVICCPKSVTKAWINLETSAALVREESGAQGADTSADGSVVERGDLISVKETMKKTRGRQPARFCLLDNALSAHGITFLHGVLKFQRALSLLGSNLAIVGVL